MKTRKLIPLSRPYLPPLNELDAELKEIWETRVLTNNAKFHNKFEEDLRNFLDVPHVCLFNNCTTALLVAIKALDLKGEVITTPFTFIATTNSLIWSGLKPVYVDVNPETLNIDTKKIQKKLHLKLVQ